MLHPQSPWPSERPEQLAEALREQGATPEELADLLPAVHRLSEWQAPQPSLADTQRLLAQLTPELPALSPVRQAIRARQQRQGANLSWLLDTARTQVSLFGPAFWLVSALVTLVGAVVVLSGALPNEELMLRASGPFLAYLGDHHRLSRDGGARPGMRAGLPALASATRTGPAGDRAGL